jgi:hypothetical protein
MFRANINQEEYKKNLTAINKTVNRTLNSDMDNFRFEQLGYYQVIDYGKYYCPAWMHYGRKTIVFCDRCNIPNLNCCIGYKNFDLCLRCANELTRANNDCPRLHCHGPKSINDNILQYQKDDYEDIN